MVDNGGSRFLYIESFLCKIWTDIGTTSMLATMQLKKNLFQICMSSLKYAKYQLHELKKQRIKKL
jgi:hypothetical protein